MSLSGLLKTMRRLLLVTGFLWVLFFQAGVAQAAEDIALVAHPTVPVDNLSFVQARKILLGNHQYWSPDLRVTLLIRAPVARERDLLLKKFYEMSEPQFRQHWISKIFRAETTSGPKVVFSSDMALELLVLIPGSITFVRADQVPKGLKVIQIDGRLPGDPGYSLQ
ncbi:MAG: hypothetical protein GXO96_06250 [Nitrospirae bacterium]|nr:hypothetical protein [Candidatus Manganitrophaceae bacterium]